MKQLCSSKKVAVPAWDNYTQMMVYTPGFAVFASALPDFCSDLDFYVTEAIDRDGASKLWRVTEAATGCTCTRAYRTRNEAIEAAREVLERNGDSALRTAIAKAKRTEGIWSERRAVRATKRRLALAAAEIRNARA